MEGLLKHRIPNSTPKISDWVGLNLHIKQAPGGTDAANTLRARSPYSSGQISLRLYTQRAFLNWQNQDDNHGQAQREGWHLTWLGLSETLVTLSPAEVETLQVQ